MRKVNIIALVLASLMLAATLASGQARNSPTSMAEVAATDGRKMTEIAETSQPPKTRLALHTLGCIALPMATRTSKV